MKGGAQVNGAQRAAVERKIHPRSTARARQALAAKLRATNPSWSDKKVLLTAGYAKSTASVAPMITGSVGYRAELARYGLTEELITCSLVEDIEAKPQKRVRELELGADILKMRRREDERPTVNIALFSSEQQQRIANRILERLGSSPANAPQSPTTNESTEDDTSIGSAASPTL